MYERWTNRIQVKRINTHPSGWPFYSENTSLKILLKAIFGNVFYTVICTDVCQTAFILHGSPSYTGPLLRITGDHHHRKKGNRFETPLSYRSACMCHKCLSCFISIIITVVTHRYTSGRRAFHYVFSLVSQTRDEVTRHARLQTPACLAGTVTGCVLQSMSFPMKMCAALRGSSLGIPSSICGAIF